MSNIKLKSRVIDYSLVLNYYNEHKDDSSNPLYKLDRFEGGFGIDIKNYKPDLRNPMCSDANANIKQLRWDKGVLFTAPGYNRFNAEESTLLLNALKHVYGNDKAHLV